MRDRDIGKRTQTMGDFTFSEKLLNIANEAERELSPVFAEMEEVSREGIKRVMSAFSKHRVSDTMFSGTTGYGYDDKGRDTLDLIYADVFFAEKALVRTQFVNGTHAIAAAIFSAMRAGDKLVSATGPVYDTLRTLVLGKDGSHGTFKDYGMEYEYVALKKDKTLDIDGIKKAAAGKNVRAVFIQRSRGYEDRFALSCDEIGKIAKEVKNVNPDACIIVDNCYGEFAETTEPCAVGADLVAGSLIKNPGGGLALSGGYVAGRESLVDAAAERLTVPGIGGECGSSLGQNRLMYQGLFMAPHTVLQAMKTAAFCAAVMEKLGFDVSPSYNEKRYDIIQTIKFGKPEPLLEFCKGIQEGAPIDSFVTPEPWDMPGYDCKVVMAAGAFVQGASIELSCDAPMREPYTAFMQGGLTYESGRLGILIAAQRIMDL